MSIPAGTASTSPPAPGARPPGRVTIEKVRVGDLERYARETMPGLPDGGVVPISLTRARAQVSNPHASADDLGLLVALHEGRCVGTLGIMPGRFRVGDRVEPVDWLSAWYVPPKFRNTGAGMQLLLAAMSRKRALAASASSEASLKLYDALRFKTLGPLRYVVLDLLRINPLGLPFRAAAKLLRRRRPGWAGRLDRAAVAAAWPSRAALLRRFASATRADRQRYDVRRITRIEPADWTALGADPSASGVCFERDPAVIQWMLDARWVARGPSEATPGYYFRDCDPEFDFTALELKEPGSDRRAGILVFRTDTLHGRRTVTLLDARFAGSDARHCRLAFALEEARAFGADRVVLPLDCHAPLESLAPGPLQRLVRVEERPYRMYLAPAQAALAADLDRITLDLADGDVGFA